jgi:hypothetical protein
MTGVVKNTKQAAKSTFSSTFPQRTHQLTKTQAGTGCRETFRKS